MALPSQQNRVVGRYLLCEQIGSGGMATIHLARLLGPQGFSRTVAVKQLHPQFAQNPEFVAMFLDEARLAVRIRHANVVSPIDIVASGSELLIVMDYVNGESLAALLRAAQAPLPPPIASAIVVQVLLGLHAAHEATREQGEALGLVHRDVSPQNILVGQDGVARVLDFGIAKAVARSQITEEGKLKGKIGYMAPEQLRLEAIDRRIDVFTAGIVLWEALTGTRLFVADALGASVELILRGEIPPPSRLNPAVAPELDAIVAMALAREPCERFQDAMSMAEALQRATPPASTLVVIDWVQRLAGSELQRKADLVRRAESWDWKDVQSTNQAPSVASGPVLDTREGTSDQSKTMRLTAGFRAQLGGPEHAAAAPSVGSTLRMSDGTKVRTAKVAGGGSGTSAGAEREPLRPTGGEVRGRKLLAFALAVVLTGSGAALAVLSPSVPEREGSATAEPDATRFRGASPESSSQILQGSGSFPPSVIAVREPVFQPSAIASVGSARDRETPVRGAGSSSPLARDAVAQGAPPSPSSRAAGQSPRARPPRTGASARGNRLGAPKSADCSPPWTVNEQRIKVFKAECLR